MIEYKCSKCGEPMQSPPSMIGSAERCPACGHATIVRSEHGQVGTILKPAAAGPPALPGKITRRVLTGVAIVVAMLIAATAKVVCRTIIRPNPMAVSPRPGPRVHTSAQDDAIGRELHDKAVKTIQQVKAKMEEEPATPSLPEPFKLQEFPEEHFTIAFPGTPTVNKYALAVEFMVTTEEAGYSIIVNRLPRRFVGKEAESFLKGQLESKISALKEGAGAELTESTQCVVDGNPATRVFN